MAESRAHVPRRVRIGVIVAASALFMLAIMNLILVSEQAPLVSPEERPPREWQAGAGAEGAIGTESWTFAVQPKGRSIVDLDIDVPFVVTKERARGTAELITRFGYYVDGQEIAAEERTFTLGAQGNESDGRRVRTTDRGTFGFGDDTLRVDVPPEAESFGVLLRWQWEYVPSSGADASFRVRVDEVHVRGLDAGGLPLCDGLSCARLLVILTLAVQVAAFVWVGRAPREDRRPPFMRRQAQLERDLREFDVDEPDALPQPSRRTGRPPRKRL